MADSFKTDNRYLKSMSKKVGNVDDGKTHTDNYYLKRIEAKIGQGGGGYDDTDLKNKMGYDDIPTGENLQGQITDLEGTVGNLGDNKADKVHTHTESDITDLGDYISKSNVSGFVLNDGTIDTNVYSQTGHTHSEEDITDLGDYIEKSSTSGLVKNDGTIDTTQYISEHQSLDSKTVTLTKQATAESGYAATYVLSQGGTSLTPKINIPKDFLVKSATVETCDEDDVPVEGYVVGDKYLDFVVNSVDGDATPSHIYLKVTELVDVYSADNSTLVLGTGNVFSIKDGGVTFAKISSSAIGSGANQIAAGNHTHSTYLEKSQTSYKGKNVVVDSSTGDITFENKPTIPVVVDTVEDGNSNAVTSNATYDTFSEMLDELLSEGLFISGDSVVQSGESAVLTARLYGAIGTSQTIAFYQKNTGSEDTLLGTVTTDSGVAQYIYSATGAGKKEIYSKKSSLQSETYSLLDALFVDKGTSTDYNSWTNWNNYEPKLTRSDYCKVEVDTENSKTSAGMYKSINTSNSNIRIEFDVKVVTELTNERFATLRNNSVSVLGSLEIEKFGGTKNTWHHLKIDITSNDAKVYLDDSSTPYTYSSSGITRFYINFDTDISEVDYKNFVIYPI